VTPAPRGYCQISWLGNMRVAVGKDEGKEMEGGADREEKSRIGREREGHLPMTKLSLGKYLSTGVLAYTRLEGCMI
jgi:hypothetical protein